MAGWGGRIRTLEWPNQSPQPYHLATPNRVDIADLEGLTPSDSAALEKPPALAVTHDVAFGGRARSEADDARQVWVDVGA